MVNEVAVQAKQGVPALSMSETDLMSVLKNSLYPGAKDESIKLVVNYCRAAGLDPMQKPVHIVPMSVSTGRKDDQGWDIKEMRDVVMPGIGLYRTQAARSGEYAGVTEPEFGDDVNEKVGDVQITYPKWCKVTVKRLMANGAIVEFTAKELWRENYATKSAKSADPNAMWKRRPYAQLAKCAEAQALRKAFPEFGAQPTADEIEGKAMDDDFQGTTIDSATGEVTHKKSPPPIPPYPQDAFERALNTWREKGTKSPDEFAAMLSTKGVLSDAQKTEIARGRVIEQPAGELSDAEKSAALAQEIAEAGGA
jgi:phage recombination protein Bet